MFRILAYQLDTAYYSHRVKILMMDARGCHTTIQLLDHVQQYEPWRGSHGGAGPRF